MDETKGNDEAEIKITVETDILDVDADETIDAVREVTTTVMDVDGDGVPDLVEQTTTTTYDLDGDGVPDIVESTTATAVDLNRVGVIDDDEIAIETVVAVPEGYLDGTDAAGSSSASTSGLPRPARRRVPNAKVAVLAVLAVGAVAAGALVLRRRFRRRS